ncbi:MAG: peptide deformylase [Candidatus Kerfeldbacteria bacterium]|nr:peptide deformylase [Candidatus Kerfeldbacteria bacterium]
MTVRTIVKLGAPILRRQAAPVDLNSLKTANIESLLKDLVATMIEAQGIGLAAPQVGVSLQVAIINGQTGPFAIINPRIIKRSRQTEVAEEGCLSIPGVFGLVRRPARVTVSYYDQDHQLRTRAAVGLLARVFQHEIDHLNGILFIDKVERITHGRLA